MRNDGIRVENPHPTCLMTLQNSLPAYKFLFLKSIFQQPASSLKSVKDIILATPARPKCWYFYDWVCEDHPDQPWEHEAVKLRETFVQNPQCDKDADSIF